MRMSVVLPLSVPKARYESSQITNSDTIFAAVSYRHCSIPVRVSMHMRSPLCDST